MGRGDGGQCSLSVLGLKVCHHSNAETSTAPKWRPGLDRQHSINHWIGGLRSNP